MKPGASAAAVSPLASGGTPNLSAAASLAETNEADSSPRADVAFSLPGLGVAESDGAGRHATAKCGPLPLGAAMSRLAEMAPSGDLQQSASAQEAGPAASGASLAEPARPVGHISAPARKAPTPIEALSAVRYRVQLTASTSLKEKLERAHDLMRHRNPTGDFAPIVERALDLLLEQLMKERFGAARRQPSSKKRSTNAASNAASDQGSNVGSECGGNAVSERGGTAVSSCRSRARSARVSNATRRAAVERDGLQCTWVDEEGRRCEARSWLELDHRLPRGKGGASECENIRLLCRPHNRLAAEQEFGRQHIEGAIAARRHTATRAGEPAAYEP